ncbi:MAG: LemA family protein [Bacteroidales bacterium]
MAKKKSTTWIIIAVIGIILIWGVRAYNGLVKQQETVSTAWSDVESTYQRRMDLIPQLVATVKGYAEHESNTFQNVIEARAKATQLTVDASNLTPEALEQYQKAQGELGSALGKLMMIQENYPNLKANENFLELQAQLEGTENRINVQRLKFNRAAKNYNTNTRKFPKTIIASMFGFDRKPYFKAQEGAQTAPKIEF